jgi:hypothetical protein
MVEETGDVAPVPAETSIDGPLRAYYLVGAGDTPDEADWSTEIGWPIFRADAARAYGN